MTDIERKSDNRIGILDGWRALSILLVLFSHWFPTPRAWQLNSAAGAAGMTLFFALSGFLITRLLLHDTRVVPFLIRRLFRILPLAWLAIAILYFATSAPALTALANLLFVSNLPPARLMIGGEHLWSLCVEIQFYLSVAVLVAIGGRRALYLLPLLAVCVTGLRIYDHQIISIVTWHRIDEILAGATLALFVHHARQRPNPIAPPAWLCVAIGLLLLVACHPASGWFGYLRPYLSAAAIGASLFAAPRLLERMFTSRPAVYVAKISFALYVVHGMLTATWLGGGSVSKIERYALRIPLAIASFALAHLSTYYYESRWIEWGKKLANMSKTAPPQSSLR